MASIRPCRCQIRLSRTWHKRHVDDPYVRKAIAEGYRSRAAFKLIELDDRVKSPKLLRKGTLALELGAAPGSWTQVLVARGVRTVACDLLPLEPLDGATFVQGDFTAPATRRALAAALGGARADLLVSDLSPNRSGHPSLDSARAADQMEQCLVVARDHLAPGGDFVAKLLRGEDERDLMALLRASFGGGVRQVKPKASRGESREIYVVGREYLPEAAAEALRNG